MIKYQTGRRLLNQLGAQTQLEKESPPLRAEALATSTTKTDLEPEDHLEKVYELNKRNLAPEDHVLENSALLSIWKSYKLMTIFFFALASLLTADFYINYVDKIQRIELRTGESKTITGTAPWYVESPDMFYLKIFFQGHHVFIPGQTTTKVIVEEMH